ncbi:hypothetical protein HK096_009928, partial [Nowakowskiella sp. JEL0078]
TKEPRVGENISTAQASFQGASQNHNKNKFTGQTTDIQDEKGQYEKNKARSTKSGDWWGTPNLEEATISRLNQVRHVQTPQDDFERFDSALSNGSGGTEWMQHRRKKPVNSDGGKHFDILTGAESASILNSNQQQASKTVFEVQQIGGSDKSKGSVNRTFNIISNSPF